MRLLDVNAFLDWERGIQQAGLKSKVLEQLNDKTTKYVILSHRWGTEVDYDEMTRLMKMNEQDKDEIRQRDGYQKIIKSCEQAMKDGYMWLWIDTCCIDKRSSTELSEAINSMYRWYRNSQMCYVYLNDVDDSVFPTKQDSSKFGLYNGWPEWFSRGWTLQELIAPGEVEFFNRNWVSIGTKQELASTLEDITRIPQKVLRDERVLRSTYSPERPLVAHILSWAADRKTTREEDRAYSLMGLFGVNMPMLYGERSKAFQRLQLEIIRVSSDHSIFAWNPKGRFDPLGGVLADDPSCFRGCHNIKNVEPKVFFKELEAYVRHDTFDVAVDWRILDLLRWGAESPQLFRFDVTNLGIQVLWPVTVDPDDPRYIEAILPCRDRYGNLITINMESHGLGYWRSRHPATRFPHAYPMFTPVYLDCSQDDDENFHDLRLHDKRASWNGFTRRSAFPLEVAGDTITFSSGNTLVVLVYANNDARSRFAVGLGYYLGNIWARVVCDECPAEQEVWSLWADFAEKVYDMLWNTPIDKSDFPSNFVTIKDAHVPRSNWDARIVYGGDYMDYTSMMIDIELCPGSCTGPRQCTSIADALWLPWASSRFGLHELELGGQSVRLDKCSGQEIVLGDYGDSSTCHDFRRCGNIFEDMQQHGIDPMTSIYRPVVSRVSSCKLVPRRVQTQHDAVTLSNRNYNLALYQPKGVSLPKNEEFELLLKAWSTRLSGKCLVTTVIQCSEFCHLDHEGRRIEVGDVSKGDNRLADPDIFTTLCVIGRPLAWHREPACTRRREQLSIIREHFYALTNLVSTPHDSAGTESAHRQMVNGVVDLSAMFGLEYLKNYVGEITFFERLPSTVGEITSFIRLPSTVETQLCIEAPVGTVGGNDLLTYPWYPSLNPYCEGAVPLFLNKCEALGRRSPTEKRKTQREVESISQTLGVGLLECIRTTLLDAAEGEQRSDQADHSDYDTGNVHSTVLELHALQVKLEATEDEDEQRALEEDITGKILWFYWCGIRSEVNQLLPKVVRYIRMAQSRNGRPCTLGFRSIVEIIEGPRRMDLDDDVAHLQRIMFDAGAGISRYDLWLAVRAAEHARLSRILGTQESASSASLEVSIVQETLDTGSETL